MNGTTVEINVGAPQLVPANDPDVGGGAHASAIQGWHLMKPWGISLCHPIDQCGVTKNRFKGFFLYNYFEAWYPPRQPVCTAFAATTWSVDPYECNWVGPNEQRYGGGYHITARTRYKVSLCAVVCREWNYAEVGRAFGSGGIYFHDNDRICNPSRPECA